MYNFRPFRNSDPPHIAEIWRDQPPQRGLMQPVTPGILEQLVFSKPYFDPDGLIVVLSDKRPIGFVHAGFGANEEETDIDTSMGTVYQLMRGGRARWRIENETFNTLKNQGYHFEHNYGHGYQHLSVVFAVLMMLAFLVDQVQQLCCPLFQAVWAKLGSKRRLWEKMRALFYDYALESMWHLFEALLYGWKKMAPILVLDSS